MKTIIIIIISTTMFMVLSSWQSHCESSPGSFDECRTAPTGRRPKTKPDNLGCESADTDCQSLHHHRHLVIYSEYTKSRISHLRMNNAGDRVNREGVSASARVVDTHPATVIVVIRVE